MISQDFKKRNLPDQPGVYLFKKGSQILYIGKATSLYDRVKSYFANDLITTRGPLLVDMVSLATKVDFVETDSVLEALILEASLIKKHQPKYNTKEKDDKSYNYVVITKEEFPRVLIVRGRELEKVDYEILEKFGPFPHGQLLKEALKIIRKIFPFRSECKIGQIRPCFNYQIGLCPGACAGLISKKDYAKNIRHLRYFLSAQKNKLLLELEKEMKSLARVQKFEEAEKVKRTIFALKHIQDVALIKKDSDDHLFSCHSRVGGNPSPSFVCHPEVTKDPGLGKSLNTIILDPRVREDDRGGEEVSRNQFRIEAYDIAHLAGEAEIGVMVVSNDGKLAKDDYRQFNIKNSVRDDLKALQEVISRRFDHPEWAFPDLIVMDGDQRQIEVAKQVLKDKNVIIEVVSVVKDDRHKAKAIIGREDLVKKYRENILVVNAESHHFAITLHRKKLRKNFIK
ncbi:MAG: GIY-YIG nuclease family protein [bacterium]